VGEGAAQPRVRGFSCVSRTDSKGKLGHILTQTVPSSATAPHRSIPGPSASIQVSATTPKRTAS